MKQDNKEKAWTLTQRLDSLKDIIEKKDKDRLWKWIYVNLDYQIPRKAICKDHDAPFDFVADYLFDVNNFMVVLANRSGGKTLDFGILDTICSFYNANTEVATVGAIQSQAQKCYQYFNDFSSMFPFNENITRRTMTKTNMLNGSSVQVLTGTVSGVNSPHPQLVFLDEIDLMVWQVLQQALSMAQTKKGGTKARTVLTSTRKFAGGVMQRMIDEAPKKGGKVYQWCVWEVVEKYPEDPQMREKIKKTFGNAIPARIKDVDGYYDWEDLITKYNTLDAETWETEWLCKRPGLEGVIYGSSYSDDNNLISEEWTPPKAPGYAYLFEDFGYGEGHPDVALFCWIPYSFDRMIIVDERYMLGLGTDEIWETIDEMCRLYGYRLPNKVEGKGGTIKGWVPDPHGLTEIEDRRMRGAPIMEKVNDSKLYLVANGIPLVKKLFESGRLMITGRCINLRMDLLSYKKKKNQDGTYSKEPEKKMDNGPDALRYGVIRLHNAIYNKIYSRITHEVDPDAPRPMIQRPITADLPRPDDRSITADLTTNKF